MLVMRFNRINELRRKLALCGFGLVWVLALQGQQSAHELGEFEVLGRAEAMLELPGSGYRVEKEELESYRLSNINALLNRVPGVYFREEDGFGLLPNVSLRGVDSSRSSKLTLMEDGIPTAPAPYTAPAAYYAPTLGRMSGVEVLKGTSQVKYGPHTTGGVINYLSTPLAGRRAGELTLAAGNNGEMRAHGWASESWQTESGTVDGLVEGWYRSNDGFQTVQPGGSYKGSDATGFESHDLMLKLALTSADKRHRLEFKHGQSELDADISYLGLSDEDFADNAYQRYAASRVDNLATEHERTYLKYRYIFSADWKLGLTAYYNTFHRNWYKLNDIRDLDLDGDGLVEGSQGNARVALGLAEAIAGAEDGKALEALKGTRAASLRVRANNRDYYLGGSELTVSGRIENGEWEHRPQVGVRFHRDRIRRFQWHDLYRQAADGSWADPVTSAPGSDGNRRQQTESTAFYAENEMRNGKLLLRPGVRYEYLSQTFQGFSTDGNNTPGALVKGNFDVWAAGVAATWLASERNAWFANVYRGFSVPSPSARLNNGINEETSTSFELGYRLHSQGPAQLQLELVGFHTRFDDLIVIDNVGSGNTGDGLNPVTENIGKVDSKGIEFIATAKLYESTTGKWQIPASLSATWTRAVLVGDSLSLDNESIFAGGQDGDRVPYIPEFSVRASLSIEAEAWAAGASLSWKDSSYSTASTTTHPTNPITGGPDVRFGKVDASFSVDLFANWQINRFASLFLNINNVTDKEQSTSRHPYGLRPGAPRQFLAGLNLRY